MNGDGVSTCIYCGERVVLINFALGLSWVHQKAGAPFGDYETYCKQTVATPVLTETPEVLTGQVQFPETEGSS